MYHICMIQMYLFINSVCISFCGGCVRKYGSTNMIRGKQWYVKLHCSIQSNFNWKHLHVTVNYMCRLHASTRITASLWGEEGWKKACHRSLVKHDNEVHSERIKPTFGLILLEDVSYTCTKTSYWSHQLRHPVREGAMPHEHEMR